MDEKTIIDILVKRSNEQRQKIKEAYQQSTGKVNRFRRWASTTPVGQFVCYMVSHCPPWFLTASGCSFEECVERRSGGRGAFSAENTGPVRCLPAQTGHEGTQNKKYDPHQLRSMMSWSRSVPKVLTSPWCYFLCWMTSTHFHVLFWGIFYWKCVQ